MKKVLILLSLIVIMPIAAYLYIAKLSPEARMASKNVENSKKIKIGIHKEQLLEIMGTPVLKGGNEKNDSTFYYTAPFASSDGIHFGIDSSGVVIHIQLYE
jgi:outer membrane protein assembly factor BamE (lipoprotein component of BamABCDE complex)